MRAESSARGFGLPDDLISKLPQGASQAEKESAFERWRTTMSAAGASGIKACAPYSERDKLPD